MTNSDVTYLSLNYSPTCSLSVVKLNSIDKRLCKIILEIKCMQYVKIPDRKIEDFRRLCILSNFNRKIGGIQEHLDVSM